MGWFSSSKSSKNSSGAAPGASYPKAGASYPTAQPPVQQPTTLTNTPPVAGGPPTYNQSMGQQTAQAQPYPNAYPSIDEKPPIGQGYPNVPQPGQAAPYPGQQMPGQMPQYQQPGAPMQMQNAPYPQASGPSGVMAAPTPQHITNQYQVTMQPMPVQQAKFDSGARFSNNAPARIPPPPPGMAANSAQLAAMQGQSVNVNQKKAGFFSGGDGGGVSVMGGGLF